MLLSIGFLDEKELMGLTISLSHLDFVDLWFGAYLADNKSKN